MVSTSEDGSCPSVLAVMAHPDDAELWAGGTLALHAASAPVAVALPAHADARRGTEATAGASELGATLQVLDNLDPAAVTELLAELRPQVVVTHPLADVHPDHRRVADVVLEALPEAVITTGHPQRVYTCDTYNGLTSEGPVHSDVIIDITTTFATKMRALNCHTSQPIESHFAPMAERLARLWGGRIGSAYAEAFTPVPVLGRLPATHHL